METTLGPGDPAPLICVKGWRVALVLRQVNPGRHMLA